MTQPLVSIIIPCYNAEDCIGEAIESALNQSYPYREVIVIDDGSTDGSLEMIKRFGERMRWETGPNRGGSAARNRGLELARGELIQFLDADDLLLPSKLERQVPVLLDGQGASVSCDVRIIDFDSGRELDFCRPWHADSFTSCCLDRISTPAPVHWMKNVMAVGGFDEELPCSQERDLHLRMACHGIRFQHLAETLVTVRRRSTSVSSDYHRVLTTRRGIVRRAVRLLKERDELDDPRGRLLAGMLARDARAFLRMGDTQEADASFAAARHIHPEGGLEFAYTPAARWMLRLFGPLRAESLIQWKRRHIFNAAPSRPVLERSHPAPS